MSYKSSKDFIVLTVYSLILLQVQILWILVYLTTAGKPSSGHKLDILVTISKIFDAHL